MKIYADSFTKVAGLALLGLTGCFSNAQSQVLVSGHYRLSFPRVAGGQGLSITPDGISAAPVFNAQPAQILVKVASSTENTDAPAFAAAYSSVNEDGHQTILARATIITANGSSFVVSDTYRKGDGEGAFTVARTVTVENANANDLGWNSRFALGFAQPKTIDQYHFFAPGLWYDKNANAAPGAFAGDYSNNYFYWRETRTGLPIVMMQDEPSGTALTIAHLHPDPSSGVDERSQDWLVDSSVQYASLGAQKAPQVELALVYPAYEGEKNYVGPRNTVWVRRSHPIRSELL